jgi:hypothetical protein
VQAIANHLSLDPILILDRVQETVLSEFHRALDQQVTQRTLAHLKLRLNNLETGVAKDAQPAEIEAALHAVSGSLDIPRLYTENRTTLEDALSQRDYRRVLRYFNRKGLPAQISCHFGLKGSSYPELVVRLLRTPTVGIPCLRALKPYIPAL